MRVHLCVHALQRKRHFDHISSASDGDELGVTFQLSFQLSGGLPGHGPLWLQDVGPVNLCCAPTRTIAP